MTVLSFQTTQQFLLHIKYHCETKTFVFLALFFFFFRGGGKVEEGGISFLTIDFSCGRLADCNPYILVLRRPSISCPEMLLNLADDNKNSI